MYRCWSFVCLALVFAVGGVASQFAQAQILEPITDSPENFRQRIQQVYSLTRTAKTASDFSRVVDECRSMLATQPDEKDAEYLRSLTAWALTRRGFERIDTAAAFQRAGNQTQTDEILDSAQKDLDESLALQSNRAKTWLGRAIVSTMRGNYVDAQHDLEKAAELDPDNVKIRFNLAEVQLYLEQWSEAIQNYDAVLKRDPDDLAARNGRGHARCGLQKFDAAIQDYQFVVDRRRDDPVAWLNLGLANAAAQQWSEAQGAFRNSLKQRETPDAIRGLARVLIDATDDSVRNVEEGIALTRRVLASEGRTLENLELLASALRAAGRDDQLAEVQSELDQLRQSTTTSGKTIDRD